MMLDRMSIAACFAAALMLSGCQTTGARYVSKGPETGEVALKADTPAYREEAHKLMAAHFPEGYEIVWESEKVVGQTVRENVHTNKHVPTSAMLAARAGGGKNPDVALGLLGGLSPSSRNTFRTTSTFDQREWRIQYRRKGSGKANPDGASIGHLPVSTPGKRPEGQAKPPGTASRYDTVVPAAGTSAR